MTKLKEKIVIELETVEDAVTVCHRLNVPSSYFRTGEYKTKEYPNHSFFTHTTDHLWNRLNDALNSQSINFLTWQPPKPIKVGDHHAQIQSDGSVQVGCTRVDRATLEAIYKASNEAMGKKEEEWPKYLQDQVDDICRYENETTGRWVSRDIGPITWSYSECIKNGYTPIPSTQAEKILKKK